MENEKFKARDVQPTVLRLHPDVRAQLMRIATVNGRSLSKEIETRLRESLKDPTAPGIAPAHTNGKALPPSYLEAHRVTVGKVERPSNLDNMLVLSATDHAMLDVFHALTVEKQLALLSLFK